MPVIAHDLIDRLAEHRTLNAAPRTEPGSDGSIRNLNTGEALSRKDRPVDGLFIILSGRLAVFVDRADGPSKFIEWHEGDVTGVFAVFADGESARRCKCPG